MSIIRYPLHWLAFILLGLAIYAQTFGYHFEFDDLEFIVNNYYIRSFGHVHYIWYAFAQTRTLGFYSFAFNYLIGQLHPQGYHVFNFLIHLLAAGLVWALSDVIFKITKIPQDRLTREVPFIIAVLFLVHPCQTQAVTYISQRFESMATVFYLGSIYSYLCGRIAASRAHKVFLFICCAGFAVLGVFTKEVAVTIPMMILATELIFFNGDRRRAIVLAVGGLLLFMLFTRLVRADLNIFFHFIPIPSQSHDGDMITAKNYLLTQMRVFLTFIRILMLPVGQNLDYDYPLSRGFLDPPLTLAGMCLIGAVILSIFKLRRKYPVIAFGLAWILITFSINLAPRANVIEEHKLYLISFGFFLALVGALCTIIRQRTFLAVLLMAMIAVLSVLSFQRNQVWKNELTLWDDTVQRSPYKARPHYNRGLAYYNLGNFNQALLDYNKAIEINPGLSAAYTRRGDLYDAEGKLTQALSDYSKAIEVNPHLAGNYYKRGLVFARQGNFTQAISDYDKVIELNPNGANAYANRGTFYAQEGSFILALSDYNKAILLNPGFKEVYSNRAVSYYQLKQYDKAWGDVHTAEGLGAVVNPQFMSVLKKASGKDK